MIGSLRAVYFFYYAGIGTFLSYFAPYLRGLGFTGAQIGAVTMAAQLVSASAALAWGSTADRRSMPASILRLCCAGAFVALCGLPFARTPLQVGAVLVAASIFGGAVVPLVDSVAVSALGMGYARTRLFGSLGFVIAAQGAGLLLSLRGDRPADPAMPLLYLLFMLGTAAAARTAPDVKPGKGPPDLRDALALLGNGPLLALLAVCTLHWATCAPYHLLFGVLVRDRALPSSLTGLCMATGVLAESVALFAFPALERRFALRTLFAASFATTILRWLLVARASSPAALVLLQLLHGLTFGVFWGCAVEAMARCVPGHLRATGQAVFSAVVFGAGNALGYGLAGAGYGRIGDVAPLFTIAAAVEVVPLLMVLALARPLALARSVMPAPHAG